MKKQWSKGASVALYSLVGPILNYHITSSSILNFVL